MKKLGLWLIAGIAVLIGAALGATVFFVLNHTLISPLDDPCPAPLATVETGILRGKCRPARDGRPRYAAFLGIPYAKPPTGPLRFKSPRPADAWDGVRDASVFGTKCIQKGPSPYSVDILVGAENCLYLNVYSTWIKERRAEVPEPPLVPVVVHIHGGGNSLGTGNVIQPDYFVASGLVVVTFNYRLSYFGFLNLDNDEAPGNAALKDMIAALRWVKRNIRQFGGDPDKVTIHSCSSAAADAHWLTLLPETEGLFRGAIIKSGSALASWAFTDHHRDISDPALAALRRWRPGVPDDALLQQSDPLLLDASFDYANNHRDKLHPETSQPPLVSLENRSGGQEPNLVKMDAESYVLSPALARSRVPLIMGVTKCEYKPLVDRLILLDNYFPSVSSDLLTAVLPSNVIPTPKARSALGLTTYSHDFEEVTSDVRSVMFNLSAVDPSCKMGCRWEEFISGISFKVDTVRALRMHARQGGPPVYSYFYEYPTDNDCAMHAHDDALVWPMDRDKLMPLNTTNTLALQVLRQVTMFTNFIKHGKPILETDPVVLTSEWPPMPSDGQEDVFLRIGINLTQDRGDILGTFGDFWKGLYSKYRDGKGT